MSVKRVIVETYSPLWSKAFEEIQKELLAALGTLALRIEHVGSTAVPGLSAKPIIDIDVVIRDMSVFPAVVSALARIGYSHEGDLGIPGREAFRYAEKPHLMQHHLYVCPLDSPELHRHITFRDFLRTHPDAAARYGQIKAEGAARFPTDMDSYIAYKTPCIEALYAQCGLK